MEAVSLPPDEREAFLLEASEGGESLRLEVQSLLRYHDELDLSGADAPDQRSGLTNSLRTIVRAWVRGGESDKLAAQPPPVDGAPDRAPLDS